MPTQEEFNVLSTIAGSLTLTTFLFVLWWFERAERIKCQSEKETHLEEDIDRLLDETENLRKSA